MGCEGELLGTPWQCRNRHIVVGYEHNSRLAVLAKGAPAHLLAVAHRLGLGQYDVLLAYLALVQLDKLAGFAVGIVVDRAAAVVAELVVLLGQFHRIAYAGQHHIGAVGRDGALQLYRAIGIDGVHLVGGELEVVGTKGVLALVKSVDRLRAAVAVGVYLLAALAALALDGEADLCHTVLALDNGGFAHYLVLQVVKAVFEPRVVIANAGIVVGGGTEGVELGTVAVGNNLLSVVGKVADGACAEVDVDVVVVALDADLLAAYCDIGSALGGHALNAISCNS